MAKIALDCIRAELRRVAVDANLNEFYGLDTPGAIRSAERRAKLRIAAAYFENQIKEMELEKAGGKK